MHRTSLDSPFTGSIEPSPGRKETLGIPRGTLLCLAPTCSCEKWEGCMPSRLRWPWIQVPKPWSWGWGHFRASFFVASQKSYTLPEHLDCDVYSIWTLPLLWKAHLFLSPTCICEKSAQLNGFYRYVVDSVNTTGCWGRWVQFYIPAAYLPLPPCALWKHHYHKGNFSPLFMLRDCTHTQTAIKQGYFLSLACY